MNGPTPTAAGAWRPPARHVSIEQARAWIDAAIDQQQGSRPHGYVKVEDQHYHVATTQSGPIVSLLEWRIEKGENPGFAPVHNLFAVNLEARDKAVHAWTNHHASINVEAQKVDRGVEPLTPQAGLVPTMKPARSGVR